MSNYTFDCPFKDEHINVMSQEDLDNINWNNREELLSDPSVYLVDNEFVDDFKEKMPNETND